MAIISKPFANAVGAEQLNDLEFQRYLTPIIGSGFNPGALEPTPTGGLNIELTPGLATVIAPFFYTDNPITITHNAGATQPRIDRVILELDLSKKPDIIQIKTLQGTPSTTPVAPTIANDQTQLIIYDCLIPASATVIQASNITDRRLIHALRASISDTEPIGTPEGHVWLKPVRN